MSLVNGDSCYGIECGIINDRQRFIYIYPKAPLKDYSISTVPCAMPRERAEQLINYIEHQREKLTDADLRKFVKQIQYLKLVEFDEHSIMHPERCNYVF